MDHARGRGRRPSSGRPARRSPGTAAGRRPAPARPASRAARVWPLTSFMAEERPAVGEGAQLVDRHDARVLELAADLRLLDEPADQLGRCRGGRRSRTLTARSRPRSGSRPLRTAPMPPRAISPSDAVADRAARRPGISGEPDDRRGLVAGVGVAEQDAGDRADRGGRASPARPAAGRSRSSVAPTSPPSDQAQGVAVEALRGAGSAGRGRRGRGRGSAGTAARAPVRRPSSGPPVAVSVGVVLTSLITESAPKPDARPSDFLRIRPRGRRTGRGSRRRSRPRRGRRASRRSRSRRTPRYRLRSRWTACWTAPSVVPSRRRASA